MSGRVYNKVEAGKTGLDFTGHRQPIGLMSEDKRSLVRKWCDLNGIFMSEDGTHILWENTNQGKTELVKLFLKYHRSDIHGKEFLFAHNFNSKVNIRINLSKMMTVEQELQELDFDKNWGRVIFQGLKQNLK